MEYRLSDAAIVDAANTLARSRRGREALRMLKQWICDGDAALLDAENKQAALTLLNSAWSGYAGSAIDAISAACDRIGEAE